MTYFANIPNKRDKIFSGILYLGVYVPLIAWVPLIWLIVVNIKKITIKDFLKYHCYQALLFNMLVFFLPGLLTTLVSFISNLLSILLFFDNTISILASINEWVLNLYFIAIKVIAIYAVIWTMRGKYTDLPPISQAVNYLLR